VKLILMYLRGTSDLRLCFGGDKPILTNYLDSCMVGYIDSRKSTSDYLIKIVRGVVAWQLRLQKYSILHYRSKVYSLYRSMQGVVMVEGILAGAW